MNELLNKLIKRYEYLDFNDDYIKNMFLKAYNELKNNKSLSESILSLEVERLFLTYLIDEVRKGNDDIKTALSIAFLDKYDFLIRRRPDLVKGIEDKDKVYDTTFLNTINTYNGGDFTSLLVKNLIEAYNSIRNGNKLEVIGMQYNLNERSLYNVFSEYPKEYVKVVLDSLEKRETSTYNLIIRKYGVNYDGCDALNNLSFMETSRLENALKRINDYLKFVVSYIKAGNTLGDVKKIFNSYNDNRMLSLMKEYSDNTSSKAHIFLKQKNDVLKHFGLSEKALIDVLERLDNNEKILYSFYYGLGVEELNNEILARKTGIKERYIENEVFKIQDKIEILVKGINHKQNVKPVNVKTVAKPKVVIPKSTSVPNISIKPDLPKPVVKIDVPVKTKDETVTSNNDSRAQESKTPDLDKTFSNVKLSSKSKKEYFYLYFTDSKDSDVNVKLNQLLNNPDIKLYSGYETIKKLYGPDITSALTPTLVTNVEEMSFKHLIGILRDTLEKYKDSDKDLSTINFYGKKRKNYYVDYFINSDTTEEEKKEISEKISKILSLSSIQKLKGYDATKKLYGEHLDQSLNYFILTYDEKTDFNNFKAFLSRKLTNFNADDYFELKENFIDYFLDSVALKGEEEVRRQLKLILNKPVMLRYSGVKISYMLYGNNLDEKLKQTSDLPKNWGKDFNCFIKQLCKYILTFKEEKEDARYKKKRKEYFIDYFVDPSMSLEEKKIIQDRIKSIISKNKFKNLTGFSIAVKVYGDSFDEKANNIDLSQEEISALYYLRTLLKKHLLKEDAKQEEKPEKIVYDLKECSYIDRMVIKLYESFDEKEIKKTLLINDDTLIDSLINCLDRVDTNRVFDFIVLKHQDRIKDLLSSKYFESLANSASEVEMEIIYLKLLSKTNVKIDSDFISDITGVSKSDIENYRIMSIDDNMNNFNTYLNRKDTSHKLKVYEEKK